MFTYKIFFVLAILTASVIAIPVSVHDHYAPVAIAHAPVAQVAVAHHEPEVDYYSPPHYEFKYGVQDAHTGDIKEQEEKRVGDKVEGYYMLHEPDGTIRTVHYTADHHNGFNAVVEKSGHASHPAALVKKVVAAPVLTHAPVYSHAAPSYAYH